VSAGQWIWRHPHPHWKPGQGWEPIAASTCVRGRRDTPSGSARSALRRRRSVDAARRLLDLPFERVIVRTASPRTPAPLVSVASRALSGVASPGSNFPLRMAFGQCRSGSGFHELSALLLRKYLVCGLASARVRRLLSPTRLHKRYAILGPFSSFVVVPRGDHDLLVAQRLCRRNPGCSSRGHVGRQRGHQKQ
jgi:hypothetical protein